MAKLSRFRNFIVALLLLLLIIISPPVYKLWSWRIDDLRVRLMYQLNPPDDAVFQPGQQIAPPTRVMDPSPVPDEALGTPTAKLDLPDPTAAPTFPKLPKSIKLTGFTYVDQSERWNYCGPATLAMALNYWGWKGNRDDIARIVKPGVQDPRLDFIQQGKWDKNVMLDELANYVINFTELDAVIRYGGELELVKRLIASGFPVIIEKGYYERDYSGRLGWLGHFALTTGYDDNLGRFIYQETYPPEGEVGKDRPVDYKTFREGWQGFNYLFLVIFPLEQKADVLSLLGPWSDPDWASQNALEIANRETQTSEGIEEFFAWFNKGTSYVELQDYPNAANAYDRAFMVYAGLDQNDRTRPYRVMWYQTGPYSAYYYTGRYQDVIDLANVTLMETIVEPTLEESLYWRGLAQYALGNVDEAIADLQETVRLNRNFKAAVVKLREWGVDTP